MSTLSEQELIMRIAIIRRVLDLNRDQLRELAQAIERMFPVRKEQIPLPESLPGLVDVSTAARLLGVNSGHLKRRAAEQWSSSGDAVKQTTAHGQTAWHLRRSLVELLASSPKRAAARSSAQARGQTA
jgi:hypothetical protein